MIPTFPGWQCAHLLLKLHIDGVKKCHLPLTLSWHNYFHLKTLKTRLSFEIILNPLLILKARDKVLTWKMPSLYMKEHLFLQGLKVGIKNFCREHLKTTQLLTLSAPCSCFFLTSWFLPNSVQFVLILDSNSFTELAFPYEVPIPSKSIC